MVVSANLSRYGWEVVVGLAFLGSYLLLVLWARAVYIARVNRSWTDAHADVAVARLRSRGGGQAEVGDVIDRLLDHFEGERPDPKFRWQLTWNGAREIGDWVRLHEAQRHAVWSLPDAVVVARFERAVGQLDELPVGRRVEWAAKWAELSRTTAGCGPSAASPCLRAHLVELLAELHNARDAKYAQLASLYSKAVWLIGAGLLPLAALVVLGYGVIMLAGAVGGLVSRLQRLVYAEGLPTAYGSSWVPLFCAPLLGGLAAWAGLNLIALLQALGVVDLATLLAGPAGLLVPPPGIVGLAVLLGLSERFLNRLGSEAEKVVASGDPGAGEAATSRRRSSSARPPGRPSTATAARASGNGHLEPEERTLVAVPSSPAGEPA